MASMILPGRTPSRGRSTGTRPATQREGRREKRSAARKTRLAARLFIAGAVAVAVVHAGGLRAQAVSGAVIRDTSVEPAIERARSLLAAHMDILDVPGMQVAVWRDGRLLWSEGLGWADAENRAPVTPLTRFPIGSVSKAVTAAAAARLAEKGILDLEADIRLHVPRVPATSPPITARLLGSHLAGIRHYRGGERPGADRHFDSVDAALGLFLQDSLLFEPGASFSYSSYGYTLLSAAMEAAADEPFLAIIDEEVFGPLGMRHSSADRVDRLIPFRSRGYTMANGRRAPAEIEDPSYKWAGGGFLSTAEDLVRLGAALLEPGYLSTEGLSLLFTEARPRSGERTYYGFGWYVYRTSEGHPVRMHGGNLEHARAHLMILPEHRLVVAHLANTGTSIGFNSGEMLWLSELFLSERTGPEPGAGEDWSGVYTFRSTESTLQQDADGRVRAVPADTVPGWLTLHESDERLRGSLTVGARSMPVPAAVEVDGTLELFAVPGSWRKLWVRRVGSGYEGRWEEAGLPSGRFRLDGRLLELRRLLPH